MGRWSRYWAGRSFDYLFEDEEDQFVVPSMRTQKAANDYEEKQIKLLKLMNIRRGISNFVSIIGGRDVPVSFSSGRESYTDGDKVVVISASTDPADFDSMVGLAIHEASHVRLSGPLFTFLNHVRRTHYDPKIWLCADIFGPLMSKVKQNSPKITETYSDSQIYGILVSNYFTILNIIEDRRIDSWLYQTAPGYRPYYEEMYEKHFYSDYVKLAVHHPMYRKTNWESYNCHLLNMFTEWSDRTALPGLEEIYKIVDLPNIDRYSTKDEQKKFWIMDTVREYPSILIDCQKIMLIILEHCELLEDVNAGHDSPMKKDFEESPPSRRIANQIKKMLEDAEKGKDPNLDMGGDGAKQGTPVNIDKILKELPADEAKELETSLRRAMRRLSQATQGEVHKDEIEGESQDLMRTLESSDATLREGVVSKNEKCPVIFYRRITSSNIKGLPFYNSYGKHKNLVTKGVEMGRVLAHRLRIMNDETLTTFPYQRFGRVDKKRLHAIPSGDERVFNRTHLERIKPVLIDLTIDGSGSMGGSKWDKTMTLAVALAVAASKIRSLDIRITLRASNAGPWIAMLYDSRSQNVRDFLQLVPFVTYTGGTPEGLTFDAIREELVEKIKNSRRFFVNISDGEPSHSFVNSSNHNVSYWGMAAAAHTQQRMKELREMGVSILSYYVEDHHSGGNREVFKAMYGKDARFINVENITDIARTLNEMFLNSDARE